MSKTERKTKDLVDKYEELKSTGKIDKYLKKKAKKNMVKDRKKMKSDNMNDQRNNTLRFTQPSKLFMKKNISRSPSLYEIYFASDMNFG